MSLRKLVSAILAFAFVSTSFVPAFALTLDDGVTTAPVIAPDVGTAANGANRDVVPVTPKITIEGSQTIFGKVTSILNGGNNNGGFLLISSNGQLSYASSTAGAANTGNGTLATAQKVFILNPPTGTKFVKLLSEGYASPALQVNGTLAGLTCKNVDCSNVANAELPSTGTNGSFLIADVLTAEGPASVFGSAVPAGSIIVYFVTTHEGTVSSSPTSSIILSGFGLAADPAATPTSSGSAIALYQTAAGSNITEAIVSFVEDDPVTLATFGSRAGKVEFVMAGDKTGTETSVSAEPDAENNSVLASLLAAASTTVKIGPGLDTTEASGVTTLKVDTDALVLRAAERNDSTTSSRKYYATPFATSSFVTSTANVANGTANIATLNTALTDSSVFPNSANALITVQFKALKPGTSTASSATMVVNAVTVSLPGSRAHGSLIGQAAKGGIAEDILTSQDANGGFLGAVIADAINNGGTTATRARLAVSAIYNGTSATSVLVMKDASVLDYTAQTNQHGLVGSTFNTSTIDNATSPTNVKNGSWLNAIFPGTLISNTGNGADDTWGIVKNAAADNGATGFSFFDNGTDSAGGNFIDAGVNANSGIYTPGETNVRLVNATAGTTTSTNAWFFISGSSAAGNNTDAGALEVGGTNWGTPLYSNGATAKTTIGNIATKEARNNAIAVARLVGDTLQILPLTNKYDSLRDLIVIRPEITLTLDSSSRTEGVDVIATATGGNLSGSTNKTVARILAAGAVTANLTARVLPVGGSFTKLMLEGTTDAGASRTESAALTTIDGSSTSFDTLSDLAIATVTTDILDDTAPPLFCGGTVGTGTKGPNGVVFQPKARSVFVTENGATAFQDLADLGSNTVLRITLPTGWDLNAYNGSELASEIVSVLPTGGFSVAPTIRRVQPLTNGNTAITRAFVDVTLGTSSTPTVTSLRRSIGLVFKTHALVVPASASDFTATIAIVNDGGTSTRDAGLSDDVVLSTIGTVALATGCSTFLTVNYCDDGLSSFLAAGSSVVTSERITNGANLVAFGSTPGNTVRLVANSPTTVSLPDLCVEEGVADALPVGALADGVPTVFGSITTTSGRLHLASSFNGTTATGLQKVAGSTTYASDSTLTLGAFSTLGQNELALALTPSAITTDNEPFEAKTEFRFGGLIMAAGAANTIPPAQSFLAWFERESAAAQVTVGSNTPQAFNYNATNGTGLSNVNGSAAETAKMLAAFNNGNLVDSSRTVTNSNFSDPSTSSTLNSLNVVTNFGNTATLSNAVNFITDDTSYTTLNSDTKDVISVALSSITGSTDKKVEISGPASTLEPGSILSISTSGTGPSDSMIVPVLADGSFKAIVRASTSQSITVLQTPDSGLTSVPAQLISLAVADANIDPVLTSATADVLSGLGSIPNKGKVAVVFTVVAGGKLSGSDFVPTAAQLTLGGQPVTAVTGSTTKFIGIADLSATGGLTVASTATANTVTLSITTVAASGAKPKLTNVTENAAGFIFAKGTNLKSGEVFGFVLSNGTFSPVTLRPRSKQDKEKARRRSAAAATIPATAVYAVFVTPGKGVTAVAVN